MPQNRAVENLFGALNSGNDLASAFDCLSYDFQIKLIDFDENSKANDII